ncbi:microtubule-actin cross-linking factor 1-like [Megalops cyprinoides]|uniref:microtubule-actin cross-linking factor 1-like n=1 Tax=Megalops cyprinoides TaxID=118141 RepID=UPI0018649F98|nr:microtubule-actin cross-linking factor 1-like [Megalops cyprinoides]
MEKGWEEVLEKVNALWEGGVEDADLPGWESKNTGSLGPWPILPPPSGFGGPESPTTPSCLSSVPSTDDLFLGLGPSRSQSHTSLREEGAQPGLDQHDQVQSQPDQQLADTESHMGMRRQEEEEDSKSSPKTETDHTEELSSDRTRESDSSGIQVSNPDHTTHSDTFSNTERPEYDSDLSSATSLDREEDDKEEKEGKGGGGEWLEIQQEFPPLHSPSPENPYREEPTEEGPLEEEPAKTHPGLGVSHSEREGEKEGERQQTEERVDETEEREAQTCKEEVVGSVPCERITEGTSELPKPAEGMAPRGGAPALTLEMGDQKGLPRVDTPPSRTDSPLPLSPSKHEVRGSGLESGDADAFVVTDSFVYLAVSVLPPFSQSLPLSPLAESAPGSPLLQPGPELGESDFLSTDSFVYLAAPERHPLATDGSSTCGNSQDSDSEGSQSGVDFVLGSMTGDSDSDRSESEAERSSPSWDHWDELEPDVLQGLFCDDQSEPSQWAPGGPECKIVPDQEGTDLGSPASLDPEDTEPHKELNVDSMGVVQLQTDSLSHSERVLAADQAQGPIALFWETHKELEPWLDETEALIAKLPPPAIDLETLRHQQDKIRVLKESITDHQCHIDKLLLIGPLLAEKNAQEGATMRQCYSAAEQRYLAIKEGVRGYSAALDEAISQSSQFHDKMDPLLETLERAVQRLRQRPPVAVEVEKIREQLAVHRAAGLELDKLLPSYNALCSQGEDPTAHMPHTDPADPAAQVVRSQLRRLCSLWEEIRQRAQEREAKLLEVLDLAGKFWADSEALLGTLRDAQDVARGLEEPAVNPALIKQQMETTKAFRADMDRLSEQLEGLRKLGDDLVSACGDSEKTVVKKAIDEMQAAWESLSKMWGDRMEKLEEAMTVSVQYQDALQGMFDYLDSAVMELRDTPTVGAELCTVRQQIEELKLYKAAMCQQQVDMENVRHKGEQLLRSVLDQTERDRIQNPLNELTHLWENLGDQVTHRQHQLEAALLCLGQFQQALLEVESWLSQSHVKLDTLQPISCDPKAIEMELASHQVLRNEVFSHRPTMEAMNCTGSELLESSPGEEAIHLRDQLDKMNQSWESLLLKTLDRQNMLEAALQQAQGFYSELEDCLQWLRCTERQLSATKPTGGLPETAREQLQQHMELQGQLEQREEQFRRLLERGQAVLLSRGGAEDRAGAGPAQTQPNLALLQRMWTSLSAKMDERRVKLEEAVALATGFQGSLQVCVNWLIQAEQTLNMAPPPSLILEMVQLQIEQHKEFVNEVHSHREQVLLLEKVGSQLRSASLEQDEVLISNLLLRVHARWHQLAKSSMEREQHLEEARKTAQQFDEAFGALWAWLEETERQLDSELNISDEPDKVNQELAKQQELRKALCSKQPLYYSTIRSGSSMRNKATLPTDTQKLDTLLGEVRDKWDRVCVKSMERQQALEESMLCSGQCEGAIQLMVDWLCRAEPQLSEDQPIHGDLDLVAHLLEAHKVFQRELWKRTSSVQALKRSAGELMETGRGDAAWVGVLLQELSLRWDRVCTLSVNKQNRLQQALKQAQEFRNMVQMLLVWLSGAGQTRFRGALPDDAESLQALVHAHAAFMQALEEKKEEVDRATALGEAILSDCHPDGITAIRQRVTTLRTRFQEVLTWAKQHKQLLEGSLAELLNNSILLEELLSWLLWAENTLVQRESVPFPHDNLQLKTLIIEHQVFMEEMMQKQTDVERLTKTFQRKQADAAEGMQVAGGNPRLAQLCSLWQQVWQLSLDRQSKLSIALNRLEELEECTAFDFDTWRRKFVQWVNHRKCHVMDVFRRIDEDQDGKVSRHEFAEVIVATDFPTSQREVAAVADLFGGDGHIDYYEFVSALHSNNDAYAPTPEADRIKDEVTRQVVQCKCMKRFQVEQIGQNQYRFGDSDWVCTLRMLCSTVVVQVGGGWMSLNEFLLKYDPCRDVRRSSVRGRTSRGVRGVDSLDGQ